MKVRHRSPAAAPLGRAARSPWAVAAAVVSALALSACGGGSSSGSSGTSGSGGNAWATVNVGIALSPPKAIFMGPYVAQAQGFFAKEHLHVKFISMPNGLQTELGTTAGSIDFGFSSASDSIEAAAQHAPIHAIWSYGTKLDTQCIGAPGIKTAKNLIGRPVGSTRDAGVPDPLPPARLVNRPARHGSEEAVRPRRGRAF